MGAADWSSVGELSAPTKDAIDSLAFATMTPVQAATIPLFLSHKDVVVQAATGSGKTLAFLVPVFEMFERRRKAVDTKLKGLGPRDVIALIITPTRELASQIYEVAQYFAKYHTSAHVLQLVGGRDVNADVAAAMNRGANIIVATPGRLEDVLQSGRVNDLNVRELDALILDEADTLLEMGFSQTIAKIIGFLPRQRRTGLFSATLSEKLDGIIHAGLRNPFRVEVSVTSKRKEVQMTPSTLTNQFMIVEPETKLSRLLSLLKARRSQKTILFVLTCATVDYFSVILLELIPELKLAALHGRMKQKQRDQIYASFRSGESSVLLCTDLAARGIDLPDVQLIIQYDPPQDPSYFVHRVGRTARIGRSGEAIVFLLPEEKDYVNYMAVEKVPLVQIDAPTIELEHEKVTATIREIALSDRAVMEKAQRAFVSFIRAYKEHTLRYIFRLHLLPVDKVAMGWGLLFIPRMPELRDISRCDFLAVDIDPDSIPFKDPKREAIRQANMEATLEKRRKAKEDRDQRRKEQERARREATKSRRKRKQSSAKERNAEWDELAHEARMMKRLKNGKITLDEFEQSVGERCF